MSDELTGEGIGWESAAFSSGTWERNTHSSDARCVAYDVPREQSASSRTRTSILPSAAKESRQENDRACDRALLRNLFRELKTIAEEFIVAVKEDDLLSKGIHGCDLSARLEALWEMRGVREQEWCESLNFLQAALRQEEFERFSLEQAEAITSCLDVLCGGAVEREDILRVRRILRKANFDPWKAISSVENLKDD